MATVVNTIRGDQLAEYTSFSGTGNNQDRELTVNGIVPVGTAADTFTVTIEQVNGGVTQFQNGQFVTITDDAGAIIMPRTSVNPDAEQGRAGGDEHLLITGANFIIDLGGFDGETVVYTEVDENADPDVGDNDGQLDFADFPCFTPGTLIQTPRGAIDVIDLAVGDLVSTTDHGPVALTWVGRSELDLSHEPDSKKPILLMQDCLGPGLPSAPLAVSPDHRILVQPNAIAHDPQLAPAKGLIDLARVRQMRGKQHVTYVSLFTATHQVIFANGLAVETLYPGQEALKRLMPLARASLLAACPKIGKGDLATNYPPARELLTVKQAKALCTQGLTGQSQKTPSADLATSG